jgi:hypothetical protein
MCLNVPHTHVLENPANDRRAFDKGDDVHRGTASGTNQWGDQINFFDELNPTWNPVSSPGPDSADSP